MPGAMMLRARQKPQNRYQEKFGVIETRAAFKLISRAKTTIMESAMETREPFERPCKPASRHREGSIPAISPTKRHTEGAGYFSRKYASRLATPIKPMA